MHEIQELIERLQQAREAYYNDEPFLSDAEFDALEDQLRDLDSANPYFNAVGAKPKSGWTKVRHRMPMGSLSKAQNRKELAAWNINARHAEDLVVSEKLDGISLSLRYQDGKLVQAATRGDGEEGDDITRNVLLMQGVRRKLSEKFSGHIRAEVVLTKSDHERIPEYKNLRNAAAGIAKREKDNSLCKHLTVICYQVIDDSKPFECKEDEFMWLEQNQFETPNWASTNLQGVHEAYQEYVENARTELDYDIDGLVVEVNDLELAEELGESDGRPRGACAFKFPHDEQRAKLLEIVWQVGNSGRVTPVAYFEPVKLAGATVSQASLHNVPNIEALWSNCQPKPGDEVLVSRRNDVIPYVEKVLRRTSTNRMKPLLTCPSCEGQLGRDGAYLLCRNTQACPAQQSGAVKRWIKKLDIKEWGTALIDTLCTQGNVTQISDIYRLTVEDLASFEISGKRVGDSAAQKLVKNLHAKGTLHLADFVGAMGIELWGQSMCRTLVEAGYDTFEKMEAASVSDLSSIAGIGYTKASKFTAGFRAKKKTMKALLKVVKIKQHAANGPLQGKSFCFTGIRNKDLEGKLRDAGGSVKNSVSKELSYLVAKDPKSTSGKAKKARECGVRIVSISDVENMLTSYKEVT